MNITEISQLPNKYEEFVKAYTQNPAEVILCGAGEGADWVISLLKQRNISPVAMVDKNLRGRGNNGISIISYKDLTEQYKRENVYLVITSPKYEEEIFDTLKVHFPEKSIFSFECELYYHYIDDINYYRNYIWDKASGFMDLYGKLSDDMSRITLENVLKGRISGEWKCFKEVYVPDQYFAKDIIKLESDEVFLDVGAFIGDTVEYITKMTGGDYKKIYCFEPDKTCLADLRKNTSKYREIEIVEKGAWNKRETLYMNEDSEHGASSINRTDGYKIELDQIDNCIDESERVTHIKMDIEGAELKALQGAERTIRMYKPKLAICVYHKNEDILDISSYLLSVVPEYKLYLRHHNISGTETVLYAVL